MLAVHLYDAPTTENRQAQNIFVQGTASRNAQVCHSSLKLKMTMFGRSAAKVRGETVV